MSEGDRPARDDDAALPPELTAADQALLEALENAWRPQELEPAALDAILAQALNTSTTAATAESYRTEDAGEDENGAEDEVSSEELAQAEALRAALEDDTADPAADLLRALRAAAAPEPLAAATQAGLLAATLNTPAKLRRKRATLVYAAFGGVGAALALAAGFVLLFRPLLGERAESARQLSAMVPSRSTTVLFDHAFERGKTSERIDRIATARARDLRSNRYRSWGVE